MFKKKILIPLILVFIILLSFGLRLYKIDSPLADHHSWRQADTAAVARNFIKEGFDFFHPRIDNMTSINILSEGNEERLFMVEPPIYQTIIFPFYKIFGVKESLARLVSIIFSLGAMVFLYLLVSRLTNKWIGLLAAFFMGVLPYSIFYSRTVLPESLILFTNIGMLYYFYRWLKEERISLGILAWLFTALSLLLKTFPFFLLLPLAYFLYQRWGFAFLKQKKIWLFAFLAVIPFVLWRFWAKQFPDGIPSFIWLFNEGGIRFRPAFFHWIFAGRIGKLILGYWGLVPFVLGLILKPFRKEGYFFHLWLVAFLIYVSVFAAGNVTHDYYQIPFIPIAAVFLAKGSFWLLTIPKKYFSRLLSWLVLAVCLLFMIGFSWFEVRGFYLIQGGVDLAGRAVDELTPKDALVLTGDSNDATLLYNTNRYGWTGGYASYFPNSKGTIQKIKEMGGTVYVTTKFDRDSEFGQEMLQNYQIIKETDQYIIFSL